MPRRPGLRVVARKGTASLYIAGTVRGQRIYESAGTANQSLAEERRAVREAELYRGAIHGARPVGTLGHAIDAYLDTEERSPVTARLLVRLLKHFGEVRLDTIDQTAIDQACRVVLRAGAGPATKLRGVIGPIRAVMMHAHLRGNGPRPAFETPRQPKGRTAWMTPTQARALIDNAAPHLKPLLVFLLGTGARLSEALELDWRQVDLQHARATFLITKSGLDRIADLPPAAVAALANLPHRDGFVFLRPTHSGHMRPYADKHREEGGQIKAAWRGACRRAGLDGFTPHSCRHTWASWRHAWHRDLVRLRDEGGWATVSMVERYAHLVPQGMLSAIGEFWGLSFDKSATGGFDERATA